MAGIEEGRGEPQGQGIEFVGDVIVQPGKSFYDQPPFEQLIQKAAVRLGVTRERITIVLTRIANNKELQKGDKEELILSRYREDPSLARNLFPERVGSDQEVAALQETLRDLHDLPLPKLEGRISWLTYIRRKLTGSEMYDDSGAYTFKDKSVVVPVPSYFAWLEEALSREQRIKSGAVSAAVFDAFPQLTGTPLGEVLPQGNPIRRKWVLRKEVRGVKGPKR